MARKRVLPGCVEQVKSFLAKEVGSAVVQHGNQNFQPEIFS